MARAPMSDSEARVTFVREDFYAVLGERSVDRVTATRRADEAERGLREQQLIVEVPDRHYGLHGVRIANEWRELIGEHLRDRGFSA